MSQTRVTLSDETLDVLEQYGTYPDFITNVWQAIVGAEVWDTLEPGSLDPTSYAIPVEQWHRLCQRAVTIGKQRTDLEGVNHGLDFMNHGPSSFESEEAQA